MSEQKITRAKPLTLEEQEKILIVADGLLAEEDNWVKGMWKCPAVARDEEGRPIRKDNYGYEQATDKNGNRLYNYCIEGAVNQATYDVVGEERARALGAIKGKGEELTFDGSNNRSSPTKRMGLDKIAYDLFADEMKDMGIWRGSTKRTSSGLAMSYNDHASYAYKGVKKILRTRLTEVQKALGRRKKKA